MDSTCTLLVLSLVVYCRQVRQIRSGFRAHYKIVLLRPTYLLTYIYRLALLLQAVTGREPHVILGLVHQITAFCLVESTAIQIPTYTVNSFSYMRFKK